MNRLTLFNLDKFVGQVLFFMHEYISYFSIQSKRYECHTSFMCKNLKRALQESTGEKYRSVVIGIKSVKNISYKT